MCGCGRAVHNVLTYTRPNVCAVPTCTLPGRNGACTCTFPTSNATSMEDGGPQMVRHRHCPCPTVPVMKLLPFCVCIQHAFRR